MGRGETDHPFQTAGNRIAGDYQGDPSGVAQTITYGYQERFPLGRFPPEQVCKPLKSPDKLLKDQLLPVAQGGHFWEATSKSLERPGNRPVMPEILRLARCEKSLLVCLDSYREAQEEISQA